jgi:malate dehydrogenase (oxaloacetate-decarboxylating)(NADP+)
METMLKPARGGEKDVLDKDASATPLGGVNDTYGEDAATEDLPVTPWARMVASGMELLRDPSYNKGTAFTEEERDFHYLRGLLPPAVFSQELQMERILHNLRQYETPLEKYVDIMDLQVQLNSCHCLCLQPSLPNLACTSLSRLCTLVVV